MSESEREMNLHDFVRIALKRKKIIVSVFFAFVGIASAVCLFMPKMY